MAATTTIFEIRPHRGGWQCFEAAGVAPYFVGSDAQEQAMRYALGRTSHRVGEVRIYSSVGEVDRTIPFDERARKL